MRLWSNTRTTTPDIIDPPHRSRFRTHRSPQRPRHAHHQQPNNPHTADELTNHGKSRLAQMTPMSTSNLRTRK
ncbi:hypothetical protein BN381_70086 [Candidatus Microthrix parvicella RN1]|uniref:Uncharacterized protein n=1 Tax=Candidatus Neomicrothrix parvicella RN1 TaxID=1229780 RepID=R4Z7E9_9ACTN|nr:hypothetical protein BN381_70086 [Candidatus Microthrix parvicella RN1]